MTLSALLAALSSNTNVNITLMESNDTQLITFMAGGYASIESDLGARTVDTIKVNTSTSITISLAAAQP